MTLYYLLLEHPPPAERSMRPQCVLEAAAQRAILTATTGHCPYDDDDNNGKLLSNESCNMVRLMEVGIWSPVYGLVTQRLQNHEIIILPHLLQQYLLYVGDSTEIRCSSLN
jgi:hypothetical protein